MSAWFTVYCRRSVSGVTSADLLAFLRNLEDPWTLAEGFGIDDEDVVDRALAHLRIEPVSKPAGVKFSLFYKARSTRPISVHLWNKQGRIRTECAEALEPFNGMKGRNITRIRNHLAECAEVVALELGLNQLEDMGLVLAGQIAEFIAVKGQGLIRDPNDEWWAMKKTGLPTLLVGQSDES